MERKHGPGSVGPRCHQPRYQWAPRNILPSHGRNVWIQGHTPQKTLSTGLVLNAPPSWPAHGPIVTARDPPGYTTLTGSSVR
eukprot:scaffold257_cov400-Pavlova_lutheri.AAC.5